MTVWDLFRNPYASMKRIKTGPHTIIVVTPALRAQLMALHRQRVRRRLRALWRYGRRRLRRLIDVFVKRGRIEA